MSDAREVFDLNNDPEVVRYTGDPPFESVDHAQEFLKGYSHYEQYNMGRWAVRSKSDHAFLGWCGLKTHDNGEVDLGFRLHRKYWNQGYATEAAIGCLRYGFDRLNIPYIIGRAMHENTASIRVLEKIGMTYWKDVICEAHPAKCYRITKKELEAS